MPNWNQAYLQEFIDKLDSITDELSDCLDSIVNGGITPALEDITIGSGRKCEQQFFFLH